MVPLCAGGFRFAGLLLGFFLARRAVCCQVLLVERVEIDRLQQEGRETGALDQVGQPIRAQTETARSAQYAPSTARRSSSLLEPASLNKPPCWTSAW